MSRYVVEITGKEKPRTVLEQRLWVTAYCRVSTEHEEQKYSLKNQIEFYKDYIRQNPYWHFVAVYYDTGSGLRTGNRPGYRQMPKDCEKRKIDLLLVKTLSHFGRDTVETIKQIRRLRQMNIGVYIESGGINTLTASNLLIEQLAAIDQAESWSRGRDIKYCPGRN